jgi:NAD(P)-dependent dehydrogenase (short-subunit alcohol dehydrogenase family)
MKLKPVGRQVVVVFGASSGIGRQAALRFAERGAKVVVSARGERGLDSLVREIRQQGGEALAMPADATDFAQVKRVADVAVERYGTLDTWVHAAAVALYAPFERTTPEEWRRVIDVNLNGQAYGAWAALPHLRREGRGALIHISSVEALRAMPLHSAYAASKHGIKAFTEALRVELQHDRVPISVTNIMPASINTPLFSKARTKIGYKPMGLPPIYTPNIVTKAILHAAENPVREMICGGSGWMIKTGEQLAPHLMDKMLRHAGFAWQRTNERKSEHAPDNLFHPVEGDDRVSGDFTYQTMPKSIWTWWERHPSAGNLIAGAALGALALTVSRRLGNGDGGSRIDDADAHYAVSSPAGG